MGSPVVITPDAPSASAGPVTITPDPPKRTWMDSVTDAAKEWWNQVNPAEGLRGLDLMTRHPLDTGTKMLQAQDQARLKAEESFKNHDYATGVRHVLNYLLPVLGPASDRAGDLLQNPDTRAQGVGATAGIATNIAAPELASAGLAKMAPAASRAALLGRTPEGAYESALKPSTTIPQPQRSAMIQTGLREGVPVSEKGVEKIGELIGKVNDSMDAAIPANTPNTVNKFAVASRLNDTAAKFGNQVSPTADMNAIADTGNDFLATKPGQIPAKDAAAIKTGTYRVLRGKYGEQGSAAVEAQKDLARGIKEELIDQFPELEQLGQRDKQLLDLQPVLERAVNRTGNHQLMGIGTPVAAGAAKALTGSGPVAAVAGTIKLVLDNPAVKSRLAIALSKTGQYSPLQAFQKVNLYHSALASAAVVVPHAAAQSGPASPDQ